MAEQRVREKPPEPNPHWAEFHVPRRDKVAKAILNVPHGYRLCSTAGSYSSSLWFYVPLDKMQTCETLPKPMNSDRLPDVVVIGPAPDTPMKYATTEDFARDEPFYCHGLSYSYPAQNPISDVTTSIKPAGKLLAGLDTVACVREDVENDRYTKAFLAYRPDPNFIGHTYLIAADVHLKNKETAARLLKEIIKSFKLIN